MKKVCKNFVKQFCKFKVLVFLPVRRIWTKGKAIKRIDERKVSKRQTESNLLAVHFLLDTHTPRFKLSNSKFKILLSV